MDNTGNRVYRREKSRQWANTGIVVSIAPRPEELRRESATSGADAKPAITPAPVVIHPAEESPVLKTLTESGEASAIQ